jgi:3-hydroxyacyl-[acyl-carrier-protein] dehydratase
MRLTEGFFIIESTNDSDNGFEAVLRTNPEHPIYKAHFPGSPITPGVFVIQAAGELLENKLGHKLYLQSIKNVKFLMVIIPEEGKKIRYSFSNIVEDENGVKAQVVVSDDAMVYAKMSLIFSNVRL